MKPTVLILSTAQESHAQAVGKHLEDLSIKPVYWCAQEFFQRSNLRFQLSASQLECSINFKGSDAGGNQADFIDMTSFTSVWMRRPDTIKSRSMPQPWMQTFVEHESNRALEAIFRTVPAFWVNPPACESNARFKLAQLAVAKECGLRVPETLVTNDAAAAQSFYDDCRGQVIYKLVDERSGLKLPQEDVGAGIATSPLRPSDLQHLNQVELSLHLFQRRIAKVRDIRITIVDDKLFAVAIESQVGKGKEDFRLDFSVPMKIEPLPDDIAASCLQFMRRLGLVFGAIDMAFDTDGNYQFFEVNPAGQWLWMEEALGLPIARELAVVLAKGGHG